MTRAERGCCRICHLSRLLSSGLKSGRPFYQRVGGRGRRGHHIYFPPVGLGPRERRGRVDPYVSKKISILRFAAVAAVVFFHAYPRSGGGFFEAFVSLGLTRWALPLLSVISGYLFFRTFVPTKAGYLRKLRSRSGTILVPYLIWSGLTVLLSVAMQDPRHGPIGSFGEALYHWLVRPVSAPLWFLQALMACVVLSPLVYLAVRTLRYWVLPLTVVWWAFGDHSAGYEQFLNSRAFPPFIVGATVALLRPRLSWARRPAPVPVVVTIAGAWVVAAALFAQYGVGLGPWMRTAMLPVVILGALAVWTIYDALRRPVHSVPRLLAGAIAVAPLSFFVYATQQPQLRMIMAALRGDGARLPDLFVYLLAPVLAITVSLTAAVVWRRVAPRTFAVVSGGRAAGRRVPALTELAPSET